jgi:hypothetical protein
MKRTKTFLGATQLSCEKHRFIELTYDNCY